MQLLATGPHTGAARGRDAGCDRAIADPHLGVETALVVRLAKAGRGAAADVDEDDWGCEIAGQAHAVLDGDLRGGRVIHGDHDRPRTRRDH
jgi:hypothetical protein